MIRESVEQLEQDHQRMLELMHLLTKEINPLLGIKNRMTYYNRILEIIDYFQVYPEIWRHPTGDVLFRRLLSNEQINISAIEMLLNDHSSLEALSAELAIIFNEYVLTNTTPTQLALRLSRHYCCKQIAHIHFERNIFKVITQCFDEQDWQSVNQVSRNTLGTNVPSEQRGIIDSSRRHNLNRILDISGLN